MNYFSLTLIKDQHNKFFKTQNMTYIMLATYHKRRYYATEIDERSSIEMSYLEWLKFFLRLFSLLGFDAQQLFCRIITRNFFPCEARRLKMILFYLIG